MLKDHQDAFGHEIYDYLEEESGYEIIERDDGYFDVSGGPKGYFSTYDDWAEHQKQAMKYVQGKVLDIGCGAGKHSLYLQGRGFDVLGIDNSPLAVETCRLRGVKNVRDLSVTQISSRLGMFDTILMLGNNFGLFGGLKRARWLLGRFHKITSEKGRIIAESRDPCGTDRSEHLEYHEFNRRRGRMAGQLRIRVRYRKYVTPWFDYLLASRDEIKEILENTGWEVEDFIDGPYGMYTALIRRIS